MSDIQPWDIDDVHKGWSLSPSQLETITGHTRDTNAYNLACLRLEARLRRELRAAGRSACVAIVRGHLRVLTDAEAVDYTARKSRSGVRRVLTADAEMSGIDVANLSDRDVATLTANRIASGTRAAAIRGARFAIRRIVSAAAPSRLRATTEGES